MNEPLFKLDFVPRIFLPVLIVVLAVLAVGWAGAIWLFGKLTTVDMIGSLICVPIVAYMVHLWIVYARDEQTGG